jgi:hypothetical protein
MWVIPLLCLSTFPHYAAIIPVYPHRHTKQLSNYMYIITSSTSASILWHLYEEPYGFLLYIDYMLALLWFLYDIRLAFENNRKRWFMVLWLNAIVFILHSTASSSEPSTYILTHSLWHCASFVKCIAVSSLVVPLRHISEFRPHQIIRF